MAVDTKTASRYNPTKHPCVCARSRGPAAATSGLESPSYAKADNLANQMGLFLQKTNIIRDYLVSRLAATSRQGRANAVSSAAVLQHPLWHRLLS